MPSAPILDAVPIARRLRRPVAALVRAVAATVRRDQRRLKAADVLREGAGDFVTAADLRAEQRLRRALLALLPQAGFLGEESGLSEAPGDWVWIVDPIDGTSNYAQGLAHYAVSVALAFRGRPVLGVVHCFPEDATYVAVRGEGVLRDRRNVSPPRGRFDDGAVVGCQWFRGQADMGFLAALQADGARIRTFGSTVVQLCDCAMGRLDANVQQQGRVWDFAAAGLVATEAGLRFTDWRGAAVFPMQVAEPGHTATVAARPGVHRRILALLRPYA
jgi:myo-inositol-1(or 4)-monophosphatase